MGQHSIGSPIPLGRRKLSKHSDHGRRKELKRTYYGEFTIQVVDLDGVGDVPVVNLRCNFETDDPREHALTVAALEAALATARYWVEIVHNERSGEVERATAYRDRQEAKRLEREAKIARCESNLANAGFLSKAPAEVVEGQRLKLAQLRLEQRESF